VSILAATGHRPKELGLDYTKKDHDLLSEFALEQLRELDYEYTEIISGMALGWDLAVAEACLELCYPLIAYLPFYGQEQGWPSAMQEVYTRILGDAKLVNEVSPAPAENWKYIYRNNAMVDDANCIFALYNGKSTGGTYQTVKYAQRKKKPIINNWKEYQLWLASYND
jgi:uncharacterized phage-like protein YoqJ